MEEDEILPCLRKNKDKENFDRKCRELVIKREIAENKGLYFHFHLLTLSHPPPTLIGTMFQWCTC